MNFLYIVNFAILAAFLTLLIIEIGIALLSLFYYEGYREKLRKYILPIWELDGTFGVFYIVNTAITYPTLVGALGIYFVPLFLIALFFILRTAFIAYSEYIGSNEKRYMQIYAISTLAIAAIAFSILDSAVSGIGINLTSSSANLVLLFINPFNVGMIIGVTLISLYVTSHLLEIVQAARQSTYTLPIAYLFVIEGSWAYSQTFFSSILSHWYLLFASIILLAIAVLMSYKKNRYAHWAAILWLFIAINLYGLTLYPHIFGSANVIGFITTGALGTASLWINLIGGIIVVIALSYFIHLTYIRKSVAGY